MKFSFDRRRSSGISCWQVSTFFIRCFWVICPSFQCFHPMAKELDFTWLFFNGVGLFFDDFILSLYHLKHFFHPFFHMGPHLNIVGFWKGYSSSEKTQNNTDIIKVIHALSYLYYVPNLNVTQNILSFRIQNHFNVTMHYLYIIVRINTCP